jgi:acylphosphatase
VVRPGIEERLGPILIWRAISIVYRHWRACGESLACRSSERAQGRCFPLLRFRGSGRIAPPRAGCRGFFQTGVPEQERAKRFHVSGRVQGVGYRYFVRGAAQQLSIAGYVRNLSDDRVEVYAIGTQAQLGQLRDQLRQGPRHALVENVAETDADLLHEFASDFSIEHDQ